jgi:RNA polymerase sigma-70 factor, ECF subfamily
MDGIRGRDPESLGRLYDESSRFVYGLALRILNDAADAEEVILDVFQQVWSLAEAYDASRGTIWSWLAVMTRNRAIDRFRQASTRRSREVPIEIEHEPAAAEVPERLSMLQEERKLVRNALESLNREQRVAIELAFLRGLSHAEVAKHLGAPLGTIKTRIRVGLRRLRDAMPAGAPVHAK